jgi:hypothetical protein
MTTETPPLFSTSNEGWAGAIPHRQYPHFHGTGFVVELQSMQDAAPESLLTAPAWRHAAIIGVLAP